MNSAYNDPGTTSDCTDFFSGSGGGHSLLFPEQWGKLSGEMIINIIYAFGDFNESSNWVNSQTSEWNMIYR